MLKLRNPDFHFFLGGSRLLSLSSLAATIFQPAFSVKAVDTTAAGDTFLGYFTAGMLAGEPLDQVLRRAAKASSIAVSRPGAADSIPSRDELE